MSPAVPDFKTGHMHSFQTSQNVDILKIRSNRCNNGVIKTYTVYNEKTGYLIMLGNTFIHNLHYILLYNSGNGNSGGITTTKNNAT